MDSRSGIPPELRSLDGEPALVVQQTSSFMSVNFDVLSASDGVKLADVRTVGSGWQRAFMGPRKFEVLDNRGQVVLFIDDVVNLGRDTFHIYDRNARPLALLTKVSLFLACRIHLELADGTEVDMQGNIFSWDFDFHVNSAVPARVRRDWPGFGQSMMGRRRFVLEIDSQVSESLRLALLGAVIALGVIKRKQDNSSS